MLSVVFAESADNLRHLLRFYAPKADKLLDVTFGNGTLSRDAGIPVVGVDKDRTTKASVFADAKALPFRAGTFGAAVFDPPYLYGSFAQHMGPIGTKTWSNVRSTWKNPAQLRTLSQSVGVELRRVLTEDGVAIAKIMNSRHNGRLVRNDDIVIGSFDESGLQLADVIVYLRTVTGSFKNEVSAQSAHGYFLIFKRTRARRLPLVKRDNETEVA